MYVLLFIMVATPVIHSLLSKAGQPNMKVSCLQRLAIIEVLKILKSLHPDFIHIYFKKVHTLLGENLT